MPGTVLVGPAGHTLNRGCAGGGPGGRSSSPIQTKLPSFGSVHLDDHAILNDDDDLTVTQPAECAANSLDRLPVQRSFVATHGYGSYVDLSTGHG